MALMTDTANTTLLYDGNIVRLELQDNKWEIVRHRDAVAILVLDEQGRMLCVRQPRRAVGQHTIEAPAGLIDPGETPVQAARRELQEEAGLDAEMQLLTRFYASPGFCDEEIYLFRASDTRQSRLPQDDDEEIEVLWLPPAEVLSGMKNGTLAGSGATVIAAMYAAQELGK